MGSGIEITLQPRVVRVGQAHCYLGMCKDEFTKAIRPFLTEVKIGAQGKGFDRFELDAVWEHYKSRNGRPPSHLLQEESGQECLSPTTSTRKPKIAPSKKSATTNAFSTLLISEKSKQPGK